MPKNKVTQGRPRKETGSKRKEHYRQLWREASSRYYAETYGKPKPVKKVEKILLNPFIETKTESHWIREDTKIDANLAVSLPEIKPETSKITSKTERDSYESIYRPKNLPTHYNLHKKVIKIHPVHRHTLRPRYDFTKVNITRLYSNLFQCNECGEIWDVNRKTFTYDDNWWVCPNSCNITGVKIIQKVNWIYLLPHNLYYLSSLERQTEFEKLMKTLPKDSPERKALKIFINSQYGNLGA